MQNRNAINKLRAPSTKKSHAGLEFRKNPRPGHDWSKIIDRKIIPSEFDKSGKIIETKVEAGTLKEQKIN